MDRKTSWAIEPFLTSEDRMIRHRFGGRREDHFRVLRSVP